MWGVYSSMLAITFITTVFTDFGLNQYLIKLTANNEEDFEPNARLILSFKLLNFVIYPVLVMGIGLLIGYQGKELVFLFALSVIKLGIELFMFFRSAMQGFQLFKFDAFASNAEKTILLLISIFLVLFANIALEDFILARMLSVGLTILVLWKLFTHTKFSIKPQFNRSKLFKLIKLSIPFSFVTILYSVLEKVDHLMIYKLCATEELGKIETGLYAGSYRFLDMFMMYLWTVLPMFFARFGHSSLRQSNKEDLIKVGAQITGIPLIFVGAVGMIYGEQFYFLFDSSNPAEIASMTSSAFYLYIVLILQGLFAITSTYLTSQGETTFVNITLLITILLNVILNIFFIPISKGTGAAQATLISTVFSFTIYLVYLTFKLKVKLPYLIWIKLSILCFLTLGVLILCKEYGIFWIYSALISGVVLLGGCFAFGLTDIIKFKEVLKK